MSRRASWRLEILVALTLLGAPAGASASPAVETQFFDELARRAYSRQAYAEALEAFLLANDVTPSPRSLYNVGVCAELVGDAAMAHAAFEEYLAGPDDDASRRQDAEARMAALEARLALVVVTSDPPGAEIYVDRRELGSFGATPRTIVVTPGRHRVELVLADHETVTRMLEAATGSKAAFAGKLPVLTGTLTVATDPPRSNVRVVQDGMAPRSLTPGEATPLPVGKYRVRVTAVGHEPAEATVTIRAGGGTDVELVARPLPVPTGRLLVDTGAVQARVLIDGKPAALTPATLRAVPAGRHQITLEARGYRSWSGTVEIRAAKATFVNATLTEGR